MSAESPPAAARPPSPSATVVKYDQYINTRIGQTRRSIRTIELASALAALVIGVLGFLLTVAVVEHWLLPGGFSVLGRSVLFAVLVGGAAYCVYRQIWPLCVRRINPVYAAQTIEQGNPSLKNSLINLLLFRQRRAELAPAVYETLEEQAAQRLTRVAADTAVDRAHLIRLGYVLVAVVAAAALYKAFSPKDPLITAERVLMPWAEVVPASRVVITGVQPGTATVAVGEFVDIVADVHGLRDDDTVLVRYTTDDGQAVDKAIPMSSADGGPRFRCRLPSQTEPGGAVGLTKNLHYYIEGGDARSRRFKITIVAAPTILVRGIDFDYPDYTGYADRQVDELGDIRAIEGTRVTIHARANGPIDEAYVDFDVDGRRDVRMTVDGSEAQASFTLALRPDRRTPQHTSYALRFTNTDGRANREPVKYPIDVSPDYAPEVELIEPAERTRDVRLDENITIGVQARDPDFALSSVRLKGEVSGREALDEPLLDSQHVGQFTGRYQFTPREHGLKAGDVVEYWAVAQDNRAPEPNTTTSERKVLRITSPQPAQQQPGQNSQGQPSAGRPNQQPQDQQQRDGRQGQQQGAGAVDRQQPQPPDANQQPQQPNEGQQGAGQSPGQPGQNGSRSEEQAQGQPGAAEGAGRQSKPSADSRGGQPSAAEQPEGRQSTEQGQGKGSGGGQQQRGAGSAASKTSQKNTADRSAGPRPGKGSDQATAEPTPVSPNGDNDAEAFDRIRRHMERSGDLNGERQSADRDAQRQVTEERPNGEPQQPSGRDMTPDAAGRQSPASAQQKPSSDTRGPTEEPAGSLEKPPTPDGQPTGSQGPSGAGDQPNAKQAPPGSASETKPAEKWQQAPSAGEKPGEQESPMAGQGERRSDSPGEQGGDLVGSGEESGGKPVPHEGTGSTGQNQSADTGSGESSEQGAGDVSPSAGGDRPAADRTGQPGSEAAGRGSGRRGGEGDKPGGQAGETGADGAQQDQQSSSGDVAQQPSGRNAQQNADNAQQSASDGLQKQPGASPDSERRSGEGAQQPNEGSPPSKQSGDEPGAGVGAPTGGGGQTGTSNALPSAAQGTAPEADEANLDYARKQTDLVLENLADQLSRKRVDRELLDQLGWSEDDLRKFVERWQARIKAAEADTQAAEPARRELDDALRSLGLRRGPLQQDTLPKDQMRELREGYRGPVPLEYRERLRAYSEGVSRAGQADE